jgi:uncharacterized membrane protein
VPRQDAALLVLASVGLVDSAYLWISSLAKTPPFCPTYGAIDCGAVTSSPFSHVFGVSVALLGLLWFAAMLGLAAWRPSFFPYLALPLWLVGMLTVGYLVYIEAFVLHAVCVYCTLAHVCNILMGVPVLRLTLSEI